MSKKLLNDEEESLGAFFRKLKIAKDFDFSAKES